MQEIQRNKYMEELIRRKGWAAFANRNSFGAAFLSG
jgi:hypothetical protein